VRLLGGFSYFHRRGIVAVALVCAVGAAALGASVFSRAKPFGFSDPGSESSRGYQLIEDANGEQATPAVLLLIDPGAPVTSPGGRAVVNRAAGELARTDGIARVVRPTPRSPLLSDDGRLALVEGFADSSVDNLSRIGEKVESSFSGSSTVQVGGTAVASLQLNNATEDDLRKIELLAAPFLLLVSFLVFRSLVAAMLPLLVGGLSIAFTLASLRLLSEVMTVDVFALNVVTVLGLGLAIDYSLFMVSRYREELARSGEGLNAVLGTVVPVGRMVTYSAATVAAAVASLIVFPQPFLYSAGVGCALVALLSAAVVIFALPAVLGMLGERVNALSLSRTQRPTGSSTLWRRLAALAQARPAAVAVLIAGGMLLFALPLLHAELTRADARVLPRGNSARVVDSTVRQRFREDPTGSILLIRPPGTSPAPRSLATELSSLGPVTSIDPPQRLSNGAEVIEVRTTIAPSSDAARQLVESIRALPAASPILVSGTSAELVDQRTSLREHLPLALAIIVASTVIAIALMTGSLVLPMLTLVVNTLTIGVALGILVLVFQNDRLESLLSYTGVGAVDISVPVLLFAVIFGLSTDYGVFLLSRIVEARRAGESNSAAIGVGLERTGRIITAAALLFAVAMGSFAFSQMIFIKEVAVGASLAVLVDATLVRGFLMPSLMQLCGRWAWWGPRGLRRLAARQS
jgi:putative drug exporter of the RND superfamily